MKKIVIALALLTCFPVFSKHIHGDFTEFLTLEDVVFEKAYIIEGNITGAALV